MPGAAATRTPGRRGRVAPNAPRVASGARLEGAAATAEAKAALTNVTAAWANKAEANRFSMNNIAADLYGIPASLFVVTILVSPTTAAAPREMQDSKKQLRIPSGILMADARRADSPARGRLPFARQLAGPR
jgi:hypothetical protein